MAQGSSVTYSAQSFSRQPPSARAAARIASISAWAVGSYDASRRFRPTARTSPQRAPRLGQRDFHQRFVVHVALPLICPNRIAQFPANYQPPRRFRKPRFCGIMKKNGRTPWRKRYEDQPVF
jgi:hypothetical protein